MLERETLAPISNIFIKELSLSLVAGFYHVLCESGRNRIQLYFIPVFSALLVVVLYVSADRLLVYTGKLGDYATRRKT